MATILVVEDEPGIALGIEDSLRLEGHEVEVIGDGAAASSRARQQEFDLILLDIMLPRKNGFEVCKELRRAGLRTPVILLTARALEQDRILGLDLGANDYVTKPFSPRELMARVRALLRYTEEDRRDRKQHDEEIRSAMAVQQNLFPRVRPPAPGMDYAGACRPALGISGDYYDFIPLGSGRIGLLLADVCGKGMPAALLGASFHAAVRAYAPAAGPNTGQVLSRANRLLFDTTPLGKYATAFYCVYDFSSSTLTYSNAGHCPPLVVGPGSVARLESLTAPVGMFSKLPDKQCTIPLQEGTRLLITSDGICEASNGEDEEFGDARLLGLVESWDGEDAAQFCGNVLDAVADFTEHRARADDMTLIAARLTQASERMIDGIAGMR